MTEFNIAYIGKFLLFFFLANILVTITAISLHELGHSLAATYYGCSNVIAFKPIPNTEISCPAKVDLRMITVSGIALTTICSILIFLFAKNIIKYVGLILFSEGIIASSIDMMALSVNYQALIFINIASYILISLSTIMIVLAYFDKKLA
jgi:hypothetical protein